MQKLSVFEDSIEMDSPFEYRNCPCCGQDDSDVLFESNMSAGDFAEAVETVYMIPGRKWGRHVRCRNCQLIYVNPIERASKINRAYSQRRSDDACIIRRMRLSASQSQVGLIAQRKNSARLLDVGCGEGFFLYNASRAGFVTKGVELSRDAAEYARREFGLDVDAKPFEELSFPDNCFDVITLWQVLEHVPYPLVMLTEAHRMLKPGGLLALSTPDIRGMPARILGRRWWNIRMLHINQFTTRTLTAVLQRTGFHDISSVSYKESISLLMLLIPILKYLRLYKPLSGLFRPDSTLSSGMGRLRLAYSSRLDNCTMIGFK
jgi:2-polyprenyl-3-methyl-5-hydroxy-6-metoxy-1,4-benzoquinol methylase